jgi:DNA replication protein DnaC
MLIHPTLDQLKALKLDGMADAFVELQSQSQAAELGHAEWLALLLDREVANRNTRRFHVRLRAARLRHGQAAIEDVDYRTPRRLDKALFGQLAANRWIAERRNVLGAQAFAAYLAPLRQTKWAVYARKPLGCGRTWA